MEQSIVIKLLCIGLMAYAGLGWREMSNSSRGKSLIIGWSDGWRRTVCVSDWIKDIKPTSVRAAPAAFGGEVMPQSVLVDYECSPSSNLRIDDFVNNLYPELTSLRDPGLCLSSLRVFLCEACWAALLVLKVQYYINVKAALFIQGPRQ